MGFRSSYLYINIKYKPFQDFKGLSLVLLDVCVPLIWLELPLLALKIDFSLVGVGRVGLESPRFGNRLRVTFQGKRPSNRPSSPFKNQHGAFLGALVALVLQKPSITVLCKLVCRSNGWFRHCVEFQL